MLKVIESQMLSLNADITGLNNTLKEDQLQLTRENPLVMSIMQKIDIIGSFVRMIYRVFEKLTSRADFAPVYNAFVRDPALASVFVRVFGIGI